MYDYDVRCITINIQPSTLLSTRVYDGSLSIVTESANSHFEVRRSLF